MAYFFTEEQQKLSEISIFKLKIFYPNSKKIGHLRTIQ